MQYVDRMTWTFLVIIVALRSDFGNCSSTSDGLRDGAKRRIRDAYAGIKESRR